MVAVWCDLKLSGDKNDLVEAVSKFYRNSRVLHVIEANGRSGNLQQNDFWKLIGGDLILTGGI